MYLNIVYNFKVTVKILYVYIQLCLLPQYPSHVIILSKPPKCKLLYVYDLEIPKHEIAISCLGVYSVA